MKRLFACLAAVTLWLVGQGAYAVDLPGPLVDVNWLADNLSKVKVLEIRPDPDNFKEKPQFVTDKKSGKKKLVEVGGHLPGSVWLDFSKVRTERVIDGKKIKHLIPEKADFEKLVRSWGVNKGDAIVLVPVGDSIGDLNTAARVYWQLKYYGEDRVAILNGGTSAWLAAQKPYSTDLVKPAGGNWAAGAERPQLLATSDETAKASAGAAQLVDARPIAQHYGLSKSGSVSEYGHIAGSKLAAAELMSKDSGGATYFLDAGTYRALLGKLGISETAPTISYCNTGHQAAGLWFVMSEVLGNKNTKLYDGSMHEWTVEKRPVQGLKG